MMPEVKQLTIQLRRPTGPTDIGESEYGFYVFDEDKKVVTLTDEHATPLKRGAKLTTRTVPREVPVLWSAPVPPGRDPYQVAGRLLYEKFSSQKSGIRFQPAIALRPLGHCLMCHRPGKLIRTEAASYKLN